MVSFCVILELIKYKTLGQPTKILNIVHEGDPQKWENTYLTYAVKWLKTFF